MNSYISLEPRAREATLRPGSYFFIELSITPARIRRNTPSVIASVWSPRCLWSIRPFKVALGMPPTPICKVAPSGISAAICDPIAASISVGGPKRMSTGGSSHSTAAVIALSWIIAVPYRYGILLLTWAITTLATSTAGWAKSADML